MSSEFTHLKEGGGVHMVDISPKSESTRTAVAEGSVLLGEAAFSMVKENDIKKGDVLTIAQIAGIMGAKSTSKLIPLCHELKLTSVDLDLSLNEDNYSVDIQAFAKTKGSTGVEMEALTGVSIAALTVYDMCKSVSKNLEISGIRLLSKTGGASGDFRRSG